MHDSIDSLQRFLFDQHNVRGELVQLGPAYAAMIANHNYPPAVADLLGELLAATSLLTALLKFEGSITVQLQGDGPLRLLVVNGDHRQQFRGVARLASEPGEACGLQQLLGKGYLVITVSPIDGERYQGVVALSRDTLAHCLEDYFQQSEQLDTHLWLHASSGAQAVAGGLLLQRLPSDIKGDDEGLNHLAQLANTLSRDELFQLPANELLHRLFHQDELRLFAAQPLAFVCGCSLERSEDAVTTLGREECEALIAEKGEIKVHCEYCAKDYHFGLADLDRLFGPASAHRH